MQGTSPRGFRFSRLGVESPRIIISVHSSGDADATSLGTVTGKRQLRANKAIGKGAETLRLSVHARPGSVDLFETHSWRTKEAAVF